MEEAHSVGECVLDEHALGIAEDQLTHGGFFVVGQQDGGQIVAKILDEELAVVDFSQADLLLVDSRGAVLTIGDIEVDGAPG